MNRKWDILASDRIHMMDMAVGLVAQFANRDVHQDTSDDEESAYKAALEFLAEEFSRGYIKPS